MKVLLDTHLALWASIAHPKLPAAAAEMIQDPNVDLHVSAVTLWEISIKAALGNLWTNATQAAQVFHAMGYRMLDMGERHAAALDLLPLNANHKDPFDRMLVAQATSEGMILLTADGKLGGYGLPNVRVV
jgi:PIN domain nuclease of toxin-antitoxin system